MGARKLSSVSVTLSGVPSWSELGPTAIVDGAGGFLGTGASVAVAAHPADEGVIYVATSGGGVWRTMDAVTSNSSPTWEPVTDPYPSTALGAIAISPLDARVVFAGTGTFASFPSSGPAVGLYRSDDGGDTWTVLGTATLAGLRVRSVLPTSTTTTGGQVVLVAALSGDATTNDGGVFRSDDGGVSFTRLSGQDGGAPPAGDGWALVEDPGQAGRVYVAVGGSQPGIYRYDTTSQAWTAVTAGIDPAQLAAAQWIRLAIAQDHSGGASHLAVGIVNSGQIAALYRAVALPGSEQWSPVPLPGDSSASFSPLNMAVWKFALAVSPQSGDVFVGGDESGGIWRYDLSAPAGPQWEKVSKSLDFAGSDLAQDPDKVPHADVQDLVFDATGNLLAATDGGTYRLPNPSNLPGAPPRKWHAVGTGTANNEAFSVSLDTLNDLATIASADNGTSAQQRAGSRSWQSDLWGDGSVQAVDDNDSADFSWRYSEANDLSDFMRYKVDKTNGQVQAETVMLASTASPTEQGSGLNNVDRQKVTNPDGSISYTYRSGNYVLNRVPGYGSWMLVGSNGLYESHDGGKTIEEIIIADPTTGMAVTGATAMAYGAAEAGVGKPNLAYVGLGGELWLRGPDSSAFTPVSTYTGGPPIFVDVDVSDWERAYVIDNAHVYRTTDGGQTDAGWSECTGNLLDVVGDPEGELQRVLVYRPDAATEVVLVGALGGLYRTLNPQDGPGAVWTRFGANLPGCFGQDVHYYPHQVRANGSTGDQLVASLYGRGVWKLDHASSELTQPSLLRITGAAAGQYIRLVRNPNVPGQLDVHAPDGAGPNLSVPLASIQHIVVVCQDGANSMTLDCTNGPINVSGGIEYQATGSDNRLVIRDGYSAEQRFEISEATTGIALVAGMTVRYHGVERVDTTVQAASTLVVAVAPAEMIQLSDGPTLDGAESMSIGLSRSGAQFSLNVANTEEMVVDVATGAQARIKDLYVAPRHLRRLVMRTGSTPSDIRITTTPPNVDTEIQSGGQDTVTVGTLTGSGGQLSGVQGPLHITNASGTTMLTLSDADNLNATTATLTDHSLTGLAPAAISFEPTGLSALALLASNGGTNLNVETTGPYPTTVLGTGAVNALRVYGTSGPLDYSTGNGVDNVHIGAPGPEGGVLTRLLGALSLRCSPSGNINVTIDDSGDSQPRAVAITDHAVIGLAPAQIDVYPSANPFLNGLTVRGSKAQMFYSLVDTPPMFAVELHGQGADLINAYRIRQDLVVDGATAVNVGSATLGLDSIQGAVRVGGGASTALLVDDRASSSARNMAMDAASITGLTAKPVQFDAATLREVTVRCGSGGNSVVVAGTVATGTTELDLGPGPDHVKIYATAGPLVISGQTASPQQVHVGSTGEVQKDQLAGITGEIRLSGQTHTTDLIVSDAADQLARRGQMDDAQIVGLAPAGIHFGPIQSLVLYLGHAGNTLGVSGTNPGGAVTVHTGGRDIIDVQVSERSPSNLLLDGPSPPQGDALDVGIDGKGHVTRTQPSASSPGSIRVTYPSGPASVITYQNIPRVRVV